MQKLNEICLSCDNPNDGVTVYCDDCIQYMADTLDNYCHHCAIVKTKDDYCSDCLTKFKEAENEPGND